MAWLGIPKEAFETYLKNCWNFKVDFGHLSLGENDHFTLSIDF